jgi:hypothetical protein
MPECLVYILGLLGLSGYFRSFSEERLREYISLRLDSTLRVLACEANMSEEKVYSRCAVKREMQTQSMIFDRPYRVSVR